MFCLVGGINTSIDLAIYNFLTRPAVGWTRISSNMISTSAAMCFSFLVNAQWVFRPDGGSMAAQAARFLSVTLFSAYVLQTAVIYFLSAAWPISAHAMQRLASTASRTGRFSPDFIQRNAVKAAAVGAGILWNFICYKYFVFAQ